MHLCNVNYYYYDIIIAYDIYTRKFIQVKVVKNAASIQHNKALSLISLIKIPIIILTVFDNKLSSSLFSDVCRHQHAFPIMDFV